MKKNITKYLFMLGAILTSIYFWFIISNLVNTTEAENWLLPVLIFGVMFVFWSLAVLLENKKWKFLLFGAMLILGGGIFTQNILYFIASIVAIGILYLGTIWIHESMDTRIKLSIWMSLRLGRRLFVAAMTLVVVGGFLVPILLSGKERTLPLINIGEEQIGLIGKIVSIFDPNLNAQESVEMTVDEYILKQQGQANDSDNDNNLSYKNNSNGFVDIERRAILTAGRTSVSRLAERDVAGEEKIMGIFAEVINNKINNYFNTDMSQSSGFAPLLFSALSFFAVFSIGSFVTSFLTFLVSGIFKVLLLTKLVKLGTKEVQVEIIN